jgi:hypothetical protein
MSHRENADVQVGAFLRPQRDPPAPPTAVYSLRRNSNQIKARLLFLVGDSEYWGVLSAFVHGQCSKQAFDESMQRLLKTPEVQILHNDLIRAILYNAHFAMVPPDGVTMPYPEVPPHVKKNAPPVRSASFATYSAADLRHIPSAAQLVERVAFLFTSRKIRIEAKATTLLHTELRKYVAKVLERCLALLAVKGVGEHRLAITVDLLMHVIASTRELRLGISPSVSAKYSALLS